MRTSSTFTTQSFGTSVSIIALAVMLLGTGCSSRRYDVDVFGEKEQAQNPYRSFYSKQEKAFQQRLGKSPLYLFRGSLETFLESLSSKSSHSGLLEQSPATVSHGDFHPGQIVFLDGKPTIDDFDASDWAPWWLDVIRAETGALLIANAQGLRLYSPGSCVEAYADSLKNGTLSGALPVEAPKSLETRGFNEQEAWKSAESVDKKTSEKFLRSAAKVEGHALDGAEVRKLRGGVGSYQTQKYLVLESPKRMIEFKDQQKDPLKGLKGSAKSGKNSACERFTEAASLYRPDVDWKCVEVDGTSYGVVPWNLSYQEIESSDFNTEAQLKNHLAWMCSRVAQFHKKKFKGDDLKTIVTSLENTPILKGRLKALAQDEAELVLTAHRMMLEGKLKGDD